MHAMPLRVGVDAWNLIGDRRGIGRYVRQIVRRWAALPQRVSVVLLVPERGTLFVRSRYLRALGGGRLEVRHRSFARSMDVVWYPWNGLCWIAPGLSIATLHDASLFSLPPADPQVRDREQRPFFLAAKLARRILTNSEFSKGELVRYLHLDPAAVDVIHLGVDERFFTAAQEREAARASPQARPYILFVGEPEERKGLDTVFAALTLLPDALRSQVELIVAGASGEYPMPPVPASIHVDNRGWVDDAMLAQLYAGASALIYASRYEGFGLPIVEAMAAGTPVIAGDAPGPREAGGDAALYVPTQNPQALATAMTRVLEDPKLAARLRMLGGQRASELSWDKTARSTLEVLEETAARALA